MTDDGKFYTIVTALSKELNRETKDENKYGTAIFDRSASPSSATNNRPAQNCNTGDKVGASVQSATEKSNVPNGNITQNEGKSNKVEDKKDKKRQELRKLVGE